jgi:hypothetical protein
MLGINKTVFAILFKFNLLALIPYEIMSITPFPVALLERPGAQHGSLSKRVNFVRTFKKPNTLYLFKYTIHTI